MNGMDVIQHVRDAQTSVNQAR
ncbi:MAG: hypothetical protein JWP10_134, partial [Nocardioidaceae bacterium]|nr:hypothetical protein [Nocardioidaceae bacterium]